MLCLPVLPKLKFLAAGARGTCLEVVLRCKANTRNMASCDINGIVLCAAVKKVWHESHEHGSAGEESAACCRVVL